MENVERVILEEIVLPEKARILTSKRYTTTAAGTILRENRVAFCDLCGRRLDSDKMTIICCVCQRKMCDSSSCSIEYRGRHYCEDDLQRVLPLDRLQFEVIHGLINELNIRDIEELTRAKKEEFDSALNGLRVNGYIEKKGISLFSYYEILDRGVLAWRTYYKAFAEADLAYFIEEVEKHLAEVKEDGNEKHNGKGR